MLRFMGLLRYLLAVAVVAYHCGPIFGLQMMSGRVAVEIFFAISGFYMAMILSGKYDSQVGTFYLNRFLRLYPSYLIVMLMVWAWFFVSWSVKGQMPPTSWVEAYSTMKIWQKALIAFSNWSIIGSDALSLFSYSPHTGFEFTDFQEGANGWPQPVGYHRTISQAWTLGMEFWFYLLVPWLMRAGRSVVVVLGLGSLALRLWLANHVGGYSTMLFFPAQFCWFALGMVLYALMQSRFFYAPDKRMTLGLLALVVLAIIGWQWLPTSLHLFVELLLICTVPWLFAGTRNWRTMEAVGHWSYPVYLVHTHVAAVFSAAMKISDGTVVIVISSLLAWALCNWVERPVDRWRQSLLRRKLAAGAAQ
ncbi:MAG: acyltransferase [Gammaproteobacteria bacterium]|nr:acyltransferase [Gammaproteobacteria bacterium]